MNHSTKNPRLIVLSSPSGGGKTTICKALINRHENLKPSISATTRAPRSHEVNGKDYFFLDKKKFEEKIRNDEFLEYEEVHSNYYGTLKSHVQKYLDQGYSIIFDVDVKGALSIKKQYPDALLFFIHPPSLEELKKRLKNRQAESEQEIEKRLERLPGEFAHAKYFDYEITNTVLEETIERIDNIINNYI